MKAFLENFGTVLGAVTVALLLMSVVHEYGYFWPIGRHFQTFVTTSDYFANAVVWLPAMLFVLYFYLDWDVLFGRARLHLIGRGLKGLILFLLMIVGPLVIFFYSPASPTPYALVAIYFWLAYGIRSLPWADTQSDTLRQARRALVIAPVVLLLLFAWGWESGTDALRRVYDVYAIQTKQGELLHRVLLRNLEKGLLVRNVVDNRIEFMKWDDIVRVSKIGERQSYEALSCLWFKIMCSQSDPPPI
jgi:4-amino-4-deoxy-L-arabinose transferase-like glycosyltransferase